MVGWTAPSSTPPGRRPPPGRRVSPVPTGKRSLPFANSATEQSALAYASRVIHGGSSLDWLSVADDAGSMDAVRGDRPPGVWDDRGVAETVE
jgi:hypothetical protein